MNTNERKFQIIIKEWDYVQAVINKSTDIKFIIRRWAITLFSAFFALSIHQNSKLIMIIALAITLLFWFLDSMRQTIQNTAFIREQEIEAVLQDSSDDALSAFRAPCFGRQFSRNWSYYTNVNILFAPSRIVLFGTMAVLSVILLFVL